MGSVAILQVDNVRIKINGSNSVFTKYLQLMIHWITDKARDFQKNIYFCFIDYTKAFDCVDHNKLWKMLEEM